MLRDQENNKDNWHHRIHIETKVEMGQTQSKNEGLQAAQSGSQGEERDLGDDQVECGKMG